MVEPTPDYWQIDSMQTEDVRAHSQVDCLEFKNGDLHFQQHTIETRIDLDRILGEHHPALLKIPGAAGISYPNGKKLLTINIQEGSPESVEQTLQMVRDTTAAMGIGEHEYTCEMVPAVPKIERWTTEISR